MNGDEIRKAREARGWSQARLAQEAGLHAPDISAIETGKERNPKVATLERIASALGLKLVISLQPVAGAQDAA